MREIEKNGVKVNIKREFLTGGQVGNLVSEAVKIYKEGGLFEDYAFNPVDMEINFYAGLFLLTIDNYNIEDEGQFEKMFCAGIQTELLKSIENAQLAYDLMWKTANEIGNSVGSILFKIRELMGKIPEGEDLKQLMEKMPKEWQAVRDEFGEIIDGKYTKHKIESNATNKEISKSIQKKDSSKGDKE